MKKLGNDIYLVNAGDKVNVEQIVCNHIEKYAKMQKKYGKNSFMYSRLNFFKDCIICAEGLTQKEGNLPSIFHLRSVRDYTSMPVIPTKIHYWARMRKILNENDYTYMGVQYIHASGGLQNAILTQNEILVADYSMYGAHGYLVPKIIIDKIINFNPLPDVEIEKLKQELDALKEVIKNKFTDETYVDKWIELLEYGYEGTKGIVDAYRNLMEGCAYDSPYWYRIISNGDKIGCKIQQTDTGEYLVTREGLLRSIGSNKDLEIDRTTEMDWEEYVRKNIKSLCCYGVKLELIYNLEIKGEILVTNDLVLEARRNEWQHIFRKIKNIEKTLQRYK